MKKKKHKTGSSWCSGYRSEEERRAENSRWRQAMAIIGLFIIAMIGAGMAGARLVMELRD